MQQLKEEEGLWGMCAPNRYTQQLQAGGPLWGLYLWGASMGILCAPNTVTTNRADHECTTGVKVLIGRGGEALKEPPKRAT